MNRKYWALLLGVIVIILGIYFQNQQKAGQVSGASYDTSIKAEPGVPIKVLRVIDGDTIVLANGDHLRYVGIDTPEEVDPRKPVQCFAKEAADKNKQLVEGQMITFQKDVDSKDQYGRWLGFVYLQDGTFVNQELVKDGFAFAYPYPPDISKSALFADAQTSARTQNLGLWGGQCTVTKLSSGREQTNSIQ